MDPIPPLGGPTAPPRSAARGLQAAVPPDAVPPDAELKAPRGPNPNLRLDPALNLVVLEFRGPDGEVVRSAPTERELHLYHAAQRRGEAWDRALDQTISVMPRAAAAAAQPGAPSAAPSEARTER